MHTSEGYSNKERPFLKGEGMIALGALTYVSAGMLEAIIPFLPEKFYREAGVIMMALGVYNMLQVPETEEERKKREEAEEEKKKKKEKDKKEQEKKAKDKKAQKEKERKNEKVREKKEDKQETGERK